MGNSHKVIQEDETSSEILKQKQQMEFLQKNFVREIQRNIEEDYQILSPPMISNQFYELRKTINIRTKLIRAVFIINKYKVRTQQRELLEKQINGLKDIDNPHLLKTYQLYLDKHRFYITCEYCQGLSLAEILSEEHKVCERKAALIMKQLLSALAQCHERDIYHTDLKFENIMFNSDKEEVIKIIDFSISRIFRINDVVEQSRKKAFLSAPELLSTQPTPKSDIWSCGMILYILLTGQPPITGSFMKRVKQKLIFYQVSFDHPCFRFISKQVKILLASMLKYNQEERPTAQECLGSPWFKKFYKSPHINPNIQKSILEECYNFHPTSKLQEAVWSFYVNSLVSFEQKQKILHIFKELDISSTGGLNQEDLKRGFAKFYTDKQADFFANFVYRRHRWKPIQFTQFLVVCTNRNFLINSQNNKKIFQVFDDDGSGQISLNELRAILGTSKQVSTEIWEQLMKEADSNSDGQISFEEFSNMMEDLKQRANQKILACLQVNLLNKLH